MTDFLSRQIHRTQGPQLGVWPQPRYRFAVGHSMGGDLPSGSILAPEHSGPFRAQFGQTKRYPDQFNALIDPPDRPARHDQSRALNQERHWRSPFALPFHSPLSAILPPVDPSLPPLPLTTPQSVLADNILPEEDKDISSADHVVASSKNLPTGGSPPLPSSIQPPISPPSKIQTSQDRSASDLPELSPPDPLQTEPEHLTLPPHLSPPHSSPPHPSPPHPSPPHQLTIESSTFSPSFQDQGYLLSPSLSQDEAMQPIESRLESSINGKDPDTFQERDRATPALSSHFHPVSNAVNPNESVPPKPPFRAAVQPAVDSANNPPDSVRDVAKDGMSQIPVNDRATHDRIVNNRGTPTFSVDPTPTPTPSSSSRFSPGIAQHSAVLPGDTSTDPPIQSITRGPQSIESEPSPSDTHPPILRPKVHPISGLPPVPSLGLDPPLPRSVLAPVDPGESAESSPLSSTRSQPVEPSLPPSVQARSDTRLGPAAIAAPPPTIEISIGRIEVRTTTAPARKPRSRSARGPKVSLSTYLQQRNKGSE